MLSASLLWRPTCQSPQFELIFSCTATCLRDRRQELARASSTVAMSANATMRGSFFRRASLGWACNLLLRMNFVCVQQINYNCWLLTSLSVCQCCSSFLQTSSNSLADSENPAWSQASSANVSYDDNHVGNGGRVENGKYEPTEDELLHREQVNKLKTLNQQTVKSQNFHYLRL